MMGLIIAIHIIICLILIGIILIQAGRGGGLVEGFSGVESMFGTKTNTFLTRTTTILSVLFFLTCLSLALLSAKQSKSLMKQVKPQKATEPTTPISPAASQVAPEAPTKVEEKTPAAQIPAPPQKAAANPQKNEKMQEVPKAE